MLQVPLAQRRSGYPVENIFEYAEGKIVDRWKVDMRPDKRSRLLTQPPWKLAASATQVLCKCLLTKNVCICRGVIDKRARSRIPFSPHKKLEQSGFVQRAAITAVISSLDERSPYSLEVLSHQYW